jgi:hypothetical protein
MGDDTSDFATLTAKEVTLTREQLANWDASARAWLKAADIAKEKKQRQLMLIVQDFDLSVNAKMSLYKSVMEAWTSAMNTVDKLVAGIPQSVHEGAVLLGLAAWHLYPDMLALENCEEFIKQNDPLMAQGGLLTIGLQSTSPRQDRGVHWSLPLSFFRYYGDPVTAARSLGTENSAASMDQLWYLTLGCVFQEWRVDRARQEEAAQFLIALGSYFKRHSSSTPINPHCGAATLALQSENETRSNRCGLPLFPASLYWIFHLAAAADRYISLEGQEKKTIQRLIYFGQRRCRDFLTTNKEHHASFFGLTNSSTFFSCLEAPEGQIMHLREMVSAKISEKDITRPQYIIRYKPQASLSHKRGFSDYAYATAIPVAIPPTLFKENLPPWNRIEPKKCHIRFVRQDQQRDSTVKEDYFEIGAHAIRDRPNRLIWTTPPAWIAETWVRTGTEPNLRWNNEYIESVEDDFLVIRSAMEDEYTFYHRLGDPHATALFSRSEVSISHPRKEVKDVIAALEGDKFDLNSVLEHLLKSTSEHADHFKSLRGLAIASEIFKTIPDVQISLEITSRPFHKSKWIPESEGSNTAGNCRLLARPNTFACIVLLITGSLDLAPHNVKQVMAISFSNHIYAAAPLLCDPFEIPHPHEVRRVIGNIGKAGLALLIPAANPLHRKPEIDKWGLINHEYFTGNAEDCFQGTSLHLSLTDYTVPFNEDHSGARDTEAFFQEALVTIFDRGEWVADLDCLGALEDSSLSRKSYNAKCNGNHSYPPRLNLLTSVDSWHEFLDRPRDVAVVRSQSNWIGRLASACLGVQLGFPTTIIPSDTCGLCLIAEVDRLGLLPLSNIEVHKVLSPLSPADDSELITEWQKIRAIRPSSESEMVFLKENILRLTQESRCRGSETLIETTTQKVIDFLRSAGFLANGAYTTDIEESVKDVLEKSIARRESMYIF